ncbi:serine protease [Amycolatopsis mediterranei S699]|uniref:Secreted serine protease n=3 Tax=Amycolatopsis mediterranei TaxID=33910 RepID=A0A0H3DA03_AMYMU|nr:S1 family peptidase [Amycolatopsis mediterranei]ADJ46903.1 secreted serine protease [Amycolatopsis mediterranei U32]AEK43711.1 serine protease [Amycolatopsis mediterranei S699]AFO78614.1 serine protease [Amycolatopsis mediterranei S699]AGT85742.1 serine protease [Amycolatopsis mediterranei RB]KDO04664.1 peptidase S1 [Amycolatopsis mediterranei]
MRRRIALALGGAAVLTASLASASLTPAAAQASPGLIAAMQRDLGLTAAQASARLTQEMTATRVLPGAQRAAGTAFGGAWFDPARGKLVVGVTDPGAAAAVRQAGAEPVAARTSAAKLDAAKAAIDASAKAEPAPAAVSGWRADPRAGSVVVTVRPGARGADVDAFLARAAKAGPVTVATAPAAEPFSAGTVGGDPYYINGNTRCSIGFSVQGGFVSAGHCGGAGSSVVGWDGSWMGTFAGSSFPGNDYSFIRIGGGWWTAPVVLGWGTVSDALVRGSWVAPVGTSVCRSGSTTHWHCGTVEGQNETVNYAQGAVYQMTRTNVCAEPGDSGGSFITGDQAQGVTSGGWGNCSSGGETWFQPVNEILQTFGVSLVTA